MTEDAPGEVIDVLQGTVEDLEEYVEENEMHPDDLEELLEIESHLQDRKTARKLLEKELKETEVTEDISEARKELSELRKVLRDLGGTEEPEYDDVSREEMLEALGMNIEKFEEFLEDRDISPEQLRNLKEMEKLVNDRKTVKKQLNDEISREVFHQDVVEIETDIEDLEKDLEELEDDSPDAVREMFENNIAADEEQEDTDEENEEYEEQERRTEEEEKEYEEDGNEESGEEDEEESEAEEGTSSRMERKKELVEDMEVDLSEEELEEIPLDQLESTKEEKDEREKMIDELRDEGLSETELRHSSTSDLRKLSDEVEPEEDKKEVDTESLEEDARTDLDFVRGAVQKDEDEEEHEQGFRDRIKEFRNRVRDVTETEDEDEEQMTDIERLEKVMEDYQKLENSRASVKIAQVLKGYLERQMKVSRELTYGEISDRLEEYDSEEYGRLADFFSRMQKETYTGRVSNRSVDDVVDSAMSVARDLEG